MAYASARELQYQVSLAKRLGYLGDEASVEMESASLETAKVLSGLLRALRQHT
jgi:four helix bundle protein